MGGTFFSDYEPMMPGNKFQKNKKGSIAVAVWVRFNASLSALITGERDK